MAESVASQKTMSLPKLLASYANADETGWDAEQAFLEEHHPRRLARIQREISAGNFPPIRICFTEKRIIDGHHRVVAARRLDLARVPVADAWDTDDWVHLAPDSGADDPEPAPGHDHG